MYSYVKFVAATACSTGALLNAGPIDIVTAVDGVKLKFAFGSVRGIR